jgi:hypothetical protein
VKPVIQQEPTGCALASAAAIAGITYKEAKRVANGLGISAQDRELWSHTRHVRELLQTLGFTTSKHETLFKDWHQLPDCALLSLKWHLEKGKPYWHWAVFVRENNQAYVLDSNRRLKNNIRRDFGRMNPRWFITVNA